MKIGVISDSHGSLTAWKKAYEEYFYDSDLIIHCGDVLYHGPRNPFPHGYDPQRLADEINRVVKPLVIVKGNCDAEVDQLLIEYPMESPYAHIFTPELKILAHHGHTWAPDLLPSNISRNCDVFISGHTHLPGIKKTGPVITLNPGSPALPKNDPQTPTVALIRDREILIVDISTGKKMAGYELG